jgi:autotransporter-associated beta strand protein
MKPLLRVAAVMSSLTLLFGCAWFAQKRSTRSMMPGSKSIDTLIDPAVSPSAIMPGSKSGTLIMSGSKSFTGSTTVSGGVLQVQTSKPAAKP